MKSFKTLYINAVKSTTYSIYSFTTGSNQKIALTDFYFRGFHQQTLK